MPNASGTITPQAYNPREIVSSLIASIPAHEDPSANPLRDASNGTRNVFLTLYTLFEKELLPALDLLDRSLISRLSVNQRTSLYLVRSAQQPHHQRNPNYEHVNYYEVRLDAWNCSCPAFTFSAFPASAPSSPDHFSLLTEKNWVIGGLTRGADMPICKHMLACVLVEHCAMFNQFVDEREDSKEEIAGWAAGWGD